MIKIIDEYTRKLVENLQLELIDIIKNEITISYQNFDKKYVMLDLIHRNTIPIITTNIQANYNLRTIITIIEKYIIKYFSEIEKELIEIKDKAESYLTYIKLVSFKD